MSRLMPLGDRCSSYNSGAKFLFINKSLNYPVGYFKLFLCIGGSWEIGIFNSIPY